MKPFSVLRLENASPGWGLVMQSGVGIECTAGVFLSSLLRELELRPDQLARVDVTLLDGQPIDDRDNALVPDGARLALAAGLPGIAGLAMKSGSAVRALRGGITYTESNAKPCPGPGRITLALFSLALPLLAGHFLARGVLVTPEQIIRYAALAGKDRCTLGGQVLAAADLARILAAAPKDVPVRLTATLRA